MTMISPWIAAICAVFAWWFFTGAILFAVRKSDAGNAVAHGRSVVLAVPMLALGFAGLVVSAGTVSVLNVYMAFLSALMVWGWVELAFLAGIITGPERRPCPAGLMGRARFIRAWRTVAHHELLLLAAFIGVIGATWGGSNIIGPATFGVLFGARISAKLNLFYGVPRINTEFVPQPLAHMTSYFRMGGVTPAFPIGIGFLTVLILWCATGLTSAATPADATGFALLTAMATLAAIEHALMVIPLPDAKLWRWMLPAPTTTTGKSNEL
jgi:putative photosynthetic complex assembly protein 2